MSAHLDTITPIQIELLPEHKKLRDEILAERIERLPQLMRPTPSACLTRRVGGMTTVREVMLMLLDGAAQFTCGDVELARQLYLTVETLNARETRTLARGD